jgi:hypothetical protein
VLRQEQSGDTAGFFVNYTMKNPELSKSLFWDTDPNLIDWQQQADAIIIRVLEKGRLSDFREVRIYYGDDRIIKAAKSARSLSKKTINFIALIFNIPLIEFRCYKKTLFPNLQWMY